MKLYTRWQVVVFTLAGIALTLLVTWSTGILRIPAGGQEAAESESVIAEALESPSQSMPLRGLPVQFNGSSTVSLNQNRRRPAEARRPLFSGWADLNGRPLGSEPSALARISQEPDRQPTTGAQAVR